MGPIDPNSRLDVTRFSVLFYKVSSMAPSAGHWVTAGDRNMDILTEYLKFRIHRISEYAHSASMVIFLMETHW